MLIAAEQAAQSGDDWKVIAALIAAALAFTAHMIILIVNGRRARRERLQELYAGGWAAVQAYKEMAFAIRRRNIDDRSGERVRLSEAMRDIQKDLAYHDALIGRERSGRVATEYRNLVLKTREIAGGIVRRSWNNEPIRSDTEMHSPEIASELAALQPFEDGYMDAVADELGGWWQRLRVKWQRTTPDPGTL
ncbi:MAG TPA: hypothetical protein VMT10_14140 [Solirubrobacteraceae bacterium]|nr:hypothetical protein [Solirubrobacteraceae bacterium]